MCDKRLYILLLNCFLHVIYVYILYIPLKSYNITVGFRRGRGRNEKVEPLPPAQDGTTRDL